MTAGGAIGVGMLGYAFVGKAHSPAARNGKHVLCEKPLGRTREEITYRGVEG